MSRNAAIATYRRFPKELFRVNNGWRVNLRHRAGPSFYHAPAGHQEGVRVRAGMPVPKALEPSHPSLNHLDGVHESHIVVPAALAPGEMYSENAVSRVSEDRHWGELRSTEASPSTPEPGERESPKARLRPNTPYLQRFISHRFQAKDVMVYAVQEGTEIPEDLVLVHDGPTQEDWSLQPAREMTLEELNGSITKFLLDNGSLMTSEQWINAYPRAKDSRNPQHPLPRNWRAKRPRRP